MLSQAKVRNPEASRSPMWVTGVERCCSLAKNWNGKFHFVFKKQKIKSELQRKRKRLISSIPWFSPQMATKARAEPNQSHKMGTQSKFPTWVEEWQGSKYWGHCQLPAWVHYQGVGWEVAQLGFKLALQYGTLPSQAMAYPVVPQCQPSSAQFIRVLNES